MDMKLKVVVLPVADVDRAKGCYSELGWRHDADFTSGRDFRVVFHPAGTAGRVPGPDRSSYASFASFSDPDGNGWLLQEITTRRPGR